MALNRQKLYDGLLDALEKGKETKSVSGGEEGEVEAKHTEGDVAGFIADAIVDYASDAEILMLTGPFMIPVIPTPMADPVNIAQPVQVQTADVGKAPLKAAIEAGFAAGDPVMVGVTTGVMAYIPASLLVFQGSPGGVATGVTVPTVPPILAPCMALGLAGAGEPEIVNLMATIIHASFKASIFNGLGLTLAGGAGPVVGQPLL